MQNRLVVAMGEERWGRDGLGVRDYQMQIIIYKIDQKQGPTV